jgi:Protein of unknown function (DUF1579)
MLPALIRSSISVARVNLKLYFVKNLFMKKIILTICSAAALLFACNNQRTDEKAKNDSTATTQPGVKTETAPPPMDPAAMQKAMADYATPGDMHKWMANFIGTWEAGVIGFMDPSKPDTSKATNIVSMTLNGLYQVGKFNGNMMGKPFERHSIMGYDNAKKMFVSTWIDNLGSGITYMTGTYDATTKTLNLKGQQTDPTTGKDMDIREEMTMIDNDSYSMIMYGTGVDGKESKWMEGTFKRRK